MKIKEWKNKPDLDRYDNWLRENGVSPKALGYGSISSQHVRFNQFIRFKEIKGLTLLDLGCGFADLIDFLVEYDQAPKLYTGVDAMSAFIDSAKIRIEPKNYPIDRLDVAPVTTYLDDAVEKKRKWDWVIACGIFNGESFSDKDEQRENDIKITIAKMWNISNIGIMFNMENGHKQKERKINLDPGYWLDYVSATLSTNIIFTSDYHYSDFTLIISK